MTWPWWHDRTGRIRVFFHVVEVYRQSLIIHRQTDSKPGQISTDCEDDHVVHSHVHLGLHQRSSKSIGTTVQLVPARDFEGERERRKLSVFHTPKPSFSGPLRSPGQRSPWVTSIREVSHRMSQRYILDNMPCNRVENPYSNLNDYDQFRKRTSGRAFRLRKFIVHRPTVKKANLPLNPTSNKHWPIWIARGRSSEQESACFQARSCPLFQKRRF